MRTQLLVLALLSAYTSIAQFQAFDCSNAIKVCEMKPLAINALNGSGENINEVNTTNCYKGNFPEKNSIWISWKIQEAGEIGFSIIPSKADDDFDFVLYRSNDSENHCQFEEEIRCMATGENLGEDENTGNCLGITGLNSFSVDELESSGCGAEDDNFLESIYAKSGETYTLFINNFTSKNGFLFEINGSATLDFDYGDCNSISTSINNNFSDETSFSDVFPNPSDKEITIEASVSKASNGIIQIFDVIGRSFLEESKFFGAGEQHFNIDISGLPSGNYYLKIKLEQGHYLSSFTKL